MMKLNKGVLVLAYASKSDIHFNNGFLLYGSHKTICCRIKGFISYDTEGEGGEKIMIELAQQQ